MLQSSPYQKYKNLEKSQNHFKKKKQKKTLLKKRRKKCYPLSFPILGGRNLTRALQSTPFQNPGAVISSTPCETASDRAEPSLWQKGDPHTAGPVD